MKKTISNLVFNMSYQIVILILPFITAPYLARVVGAEGIGTYTFYATIAEYFVCFSMLGILNYGNREVAKSTSYDDRENRFSKIYSLQLITTSIFVVFYLVYALILSNNRLISLIFLVQIICSFFDVNWLFFGLQKFKITSIVQTFVRIVSFVLIFVLVKNSDDLWIYCLIMCLSVTLSMLILWMISKKYVKFVLPKMSDLKMIIKPCLILFIPIIATNAYRQVDKIMIGSMINAEELGYYESAEKLVRISLGVISSFSAVFLPKISNLFAMNKRDEAFKIIDTCMIVAMCIGCAICFGLISIANDFIPIYFGEDFDKSIICLKGLSICVPFITWACIVRTLYLIPSESDKIYVTTIVIGALINFVMNFILINKFGTMGAVYSTVFSEAFVAISQTIFVFKKIHVFTYFRATLVFIITGIAMYILVRFISNHLIRSIWSLILEIVIGASFYMIISVIYLIFIKKLHKTFGKERELCENDNQ